jgi:hypothetical protein
MKKEKLYNPDKKNSAIMQFGVFASPIRKEYKYIDKRTKKYGKQRKHNGEMGKYK